MSPTYYLLTTTSFFLTPILYGLYNGHILLPITTIASTAASISYWYDPIPGTRLDIDYAISKTCGIVYFVYGVYHIESGLIKTAGYIDLFLLLSAYYYSCYFHKHNNELWIPCHMLFHYFTMVGQLMIL